MKLLGIINQNGYLEGKEVEIYSQNYQGADGKIHSKTVTIEDQLKDLYLEGWKPVDDIDESKLECKEGYFVKAIPYDAGDRISYRYEKIPDIQKYKRKIQDLKDELAGSDYKITKCYEASLMGYELPYDLQELHKMRQDVRDRINGLENVLSSIQSNELDN